MKTQQNVTVTVPATTSNMGPGFDCLGMTLDIWNSVTAVVGRSGFDIRGEGESDLPQDSSNLVYRCFRLPFDEADMPVPKVHITCENRVPIGRGLGSSAAAALAGLMAGNELSGGHMDADSLLRRATLIEGHPDNAAPALHGGCQIVVQDGDQLITSSVPVPTDLSAVIFVPDRLFVPTKKARSVLSKRVGRQDAVYNIGRAALLVRMFSDGDLTHLAIATQDRLHQIARQEIFPAMIDIFHAAMEAGALGVFLSGSGSAILALTRGHQTTVGSEMIDVAAKSNIAGRIVVTRPTEIGAQVIAK